MPFRRRRNLFAVYASVMLVGLLSMLYSQRVAAESERQWCGVITILTGANRTNPPTTAYGRDLARQFQQLERDFECER